MTTRNEFIKYLNTLPEDVEISVICNSSRGFEEIPLEINEPHANIEYTNFEGSQFISPNTSRYNKKYLTLGVLYND